MNASLPLQKSLKVGTLAFNSGHYWDAHEAWESAWRTLNGPDKALLQAYIMAAGALVLLEKRRPEPARRLASRFFERMKDGAGAALESALRCEALYETMQRVGDLSFNAFPLDCEAIHRDARRLRIPLQLTPDETLQPDPDRVLTHKKPRTS